MTLYQLSIAYSNGEKDLTIVDEYQLKAIRAALRKREIFQIEPETGGPKDVNPDHVVYVHDTGGRPEQR